MGTRQRRVANLGPAHPRRGPAAPPIADYALLSDCRGAALVSRAGAIDWWCAPRFDSPASFARLLDPGAGHWEITADGPVTHRRAYLDGTMVLETHLTGRSGRARLREALALGPGDGHEIGMEAPGVLLRALDVLEGEMTFWLELAPRPDYGRAVPEAVARDGTVVLAAADAPALVLRSDAALEPRGDRAVATLALAAGEGAAFALRHGGDLPDMPEPRAALDRTVDAWRSWSAMHGYEGFAREHVRRSTMVLQALTYQRSGAMVAAPTTSLPEEMGGGANWDYRFAWLRDASLTLHALWIAACPDEAERNFRWMARAADGDGHLQIMYGVEGERELVERELGHLAGFGGSAPVRIGNDAWQQVQLDVYGEVLASAHVLREQLGDLEPATRDFLCEVADLAARRWREPDSGIWEGREGVRHYLSSKVMCWVALDRALALADALEADETTRRRWARERERVRADVLERGWSDEAGAYTGAFGSDHLDASVLLMPIVGFLPADDPRMSATIDVVQRGLGNGSGLLRRWTGATDGAFLLCSFLLADCLARAGRTTRAEQVFAAAAGCGNDLGLLPEMVEPDGREMLGNFPQALSHVGVISAAWSIDRARAGRPEEA